MSRVEQVYGKPIFVSLRGVRRRSAPGLSSDRLQGTQLDDPLRLLQEGA